MTTTAVWPLEHWDVLTPGRIHVKQGPRATVLDEPTLVMLLRSTQRNVTGRVRRGGVTLDEQQITDLLNAHYPKEPAEPRPDVDPDRFVLGFAAEEEHVVEAYRPVDEHGYDRTPGQWPTGGAL